MPPPPSSPVTSRRCWVSRIYVVVQVLPIVKSAYYSNGQHY